MNGAVPSDAVIALPPRGRRRKLWEVHHGFHCSIVGTCLTSGELRRMAPRVGIADAGALTDYELHGLFVRRCREKGDLSLRLHKLLEKKYGGVLRRFARARGEEELARWWEESWERGEIAGPYWAVMSHGVAGEALLWRIYGEVHMLSHQAGASNRADLRRLARVEARVEASRRLADELSRRLTVSQRHARELEERLRAGIGEREALERRERDAERRLNELEGEPTVARLRRELEGRERELGARERLIERLRGEVKAGERAVELLRSRNDELRHHLAERTAELKAVERHLEGRLASSGCGGDCRGSADGYCTLSDLGGRKVLCVGGRAGLTVHYRALVEGRNGEFLHHDGGVEESAARLQGLLASADAVICPADCVSHDAYHRVKGFCKRIGKPCLMLDGSGISTFARALERVTVKPDA